MDRDDDTENDHEEVAADIPMTADDITSPPDETTTLNEIGHSFEGAPEMVQEKKTIYFKYLAPCIKHKY